VGEGEGSYQFGKKKRMGRGLHAGLGQMASLGPFSYFLFFFFFFSFLISFVSFAKNASNQFKPLSEIF
jgi:hypothetical protein